MKEDFSEELVNHLQSQDGSEEVVILKFSSESERGNFGRVNKSKRESRRVLPVCCS